MNNFRCTIRIFMKHQHFHIRFINSKYKDLQSELVTGENVYLSSIEKQLHHLKRIDSLIGHEHILIKPDLVYFEYTYSDKNMDILDLNSVILTDTGAACFKNVYKFFFKII